MQYKLTELNTVATTCRQLIITILCCTLLSKLGSLVYFNSTLIIGNKQKHFLFSLLHKNSKKTAIGVPLI